MLSPLGKDELKRIIEEPALERGVSYVKDLVAQIAEDAGNGSSLPLLEWALSEMWRHQQGRMITLSDYRRIGGVAGALTRHAEKAYQHLIRPVRVRPGPSPKHAPDPSANWSRSDTQVSPVRGSHHGAASSGKCPRQ